MNENINIHIILSYVFVQLLLDLFKDVWADPHPSTPPIVPISKKSNIV